MPTHPAAGRVKQGVGEFKGSLGYLLQNEGKTELSCIKEQFFEIITSLSFSVSNAHDVVHS